MIDVCKNQVIIVDENRKGYFVDALPDGTGYGVYQQDPTWKSARRVNSKNLSATYVDPQAAYNELDCWLAQKATGFAQHTYCINGKAYSKGEYQAICRGEMALPAPLEPMAVVTLHDIEYRIAHHLRGAYGEFLAVGRCLVEAKEGDLVPHGQWEDWVRRNTGMTERQAQRLMQAARSAPAGSALERLPLSKITALLLVADPQEREGLAEKTLAENTTVRALREEISALNGRVKMAQAANDKLREGQKEAMQRAAENAKCAVAQAKLDYQTMIDKLQKQLELQTGEVKRLQEFAQEKVQEILALKKQPNPSGQLSPEVNREIQRLQQELEEHSR